MNETERRLRSGPSRRYSSRAGGVSWTRTRAVRLLRVCWAHADRTERNDHDAVFTRPTLLRRRNTNPITPRHQKLISKPAFKSTCKLGDVPRRLVNSGVRTNAQVRSKSCTQVRPNESA
jgi:hypothetical protein